MERFQRFSRKRSFTFGAYGGKPEETEPYIVDPPTKPAEEMSHPPASHSKPADLFEMIEKMQCTRLEDQRCVLPSPMKKKGGEKMHPGLQEVLRKGRPFPLLIVPPSGGYWLEGTNHSLSSPESDFTPPYDRLRILQSDPTARFYRKHFMGKEHYNFCTQDPRLGAIILSAKLEQKVERLRLILRTKSGTKHQVIETSSFQHFPSAVQMAQVLCEELSVERFFPVLYMKASQLLVTFDEHVMTNNFKFGVIYQKPGQVTESELFNNTEESLGFNEFIDFLGEKIQLQHFKGFRGGLDVSQGQTGTESVYTMFRGHEIMFHVSTKLPYTPGDMQQLQRKRHIGNDIVSLVYQDDGSVFSPDMITSHFLHCFIVVQSCRSHSGNTLYKCDATNCLVLRYHVFRRLQLLDVWRCHRINVICARLQSELKATSLEEWSGKPSYSISQKSQLQLGMMCQDLDQLCQILLCFKRWVIKSTYKNKFLCGHSFTAAVCIIHPQTFYKSHENQQFREFLLTKLINAEVSCYKAERFSKLQERTRSCLMDALYEELFLHSQTVLGTMEENSGDKMENPSSGFLENFKTFSMSLRSPQRSRDTLSRGCRSSSIAIESVSEDKRNLSNQTLEFCRKPMPSYSSSNSSSFCSAQGSESSPEDKIMDTLK